VEFTDENGIRQSTNAGETRHRGVEVLLVVEPVRDLELRGSVSYAEHTYEEWRVSATTDLSGNEIEVAPREIGNVALTYKPSFLAGSSVSLAWNHLGGYWMDPENSTKYGGYDVFSLHAACDVTRDISLFGRVINLTDELYAERATHHAFRGEEFAPGLPRTVYVGVQYNLSR
jgi:outer membrane receptor protein involved in Fe transport